MYKYGDRGSLSVEVTFSKGSRTKVSLSMEFTDRGMSLTEKKKIQDSEITYGTECMLVRNTGG